jgi:glucose/mannose transport system permease protein
MKTFENLLPKLVIAPGFVLGFAFIYGFMIWNGVLSVSASRILPNYEFVGLAQYEALLASERFRTAMANLAIFGTLFIGGAMALGVLLAVLLDQKVRAEGALRKLAVGSTGKDRAHVLELVDVIRRLAAHDLDRVLVAQPV